MARRLYRSATNKVISGVCGGLGEYLDIDPTLVRLITVVGTFATGGLGFVAYLLGWIIIPQPYPGEPVHVDSEPIPPSGSDGPRFDSKWRTYLPGLILVGLGFILLAWEYIWWFGWDDLGPILLVAVGLFLILRNRKHAQPPQPSAGDEPADGASINEQQQGGPTP